MNGPENSPAFYLVNQGYDVWLNNFRGNIYSRRHITLDPETDEFWSFDMTDLRFDHMANIQFIIDTTGYPQVHTFGFSFGGGTLAWALALEPEFFESRIAEGALIAPLVSVAHSNSPLYAILANYEGEIINIFLIFLLSRYSEQTKFYGNSLNI